MPDQETREKKRTSRVNVGKLTTSCPLDFLMSSHHYIFSINRNSNRRVYLILKTLEHTITQQAVT
jgi:hypothetical protein